MSRLSNIESALDNKKAPFGNCTVVARQSPSREPFNEERQRAAQSRILMQAAQNITKSCGKREAGPATFVIRKTQPLTVKKNQHISSAARFTSVDAEIPQKSLKQKV